jgi:hypothetical protein
MYDALEELSHLSLSLQKADITLPIAHRLISRQIDIFLARKESNSVFYREACEAVANGEFHGVPIGSGTGKEKAIKKGQFYQSLADSMSARLLPASEQKFCSSLAILDPSTWPSEMSPEYGEEDLRRICDKFGVIFSEVKVSFRIFKENGGIWKCNSLQSLCNRVNTIPVSSLRLSVKEVLAR